MKRKLLNLLVLFLISGTATISNADYNIWGGAISSFQGAIDSREAIESILTQIKEHNLKAGQTIATERNGVPRKIRYTKTDTVFNGTTYRYFVEIWVMHDSNDGQGSRYQKAVEMIFNNGYQGIAILRGAVTNETYGRVGTPSEIEEGHWCRISFNHRNDIERDMIIDVIRTAPHLPLRARYKVSADHSKTYLYMTLNIASDSATYANYSYLLGSVMFKDNPYNTVAKLGLVDLDDSLDFTWANGLTNSYNSGKFDSNGFISDTYSGGDSNFPDPSLISAANLPTRTEVDAISISFLGNLDLDF